MDKVWIVYGDFGIWDSHIRRILKVFTDEEKAKAFKEAFEKDPKIKNIKELYYKWMYGGDEDDDDNLIPELTAEERLIWDDFSFEDRQLHDFIECVIQEFEVN